MGDPLNGVPSTFPKIHMKGVSRGFQAHINSRSNPDQIWYGVDKGIKRRGYFGPKIPNPDERVGHPIAWLPRLGYIGRKGKGL